MQQHLYSFHLWANIPLILIRHIPDFTMAMSGMHALIVYIYASAGSVNIMFKNRTDKYR